MIESPPHPNTERAGADQPVTASVANLLSGILDDAQTLVRQQASMLRAEIREDARRTMTVAQYMGVGAVLAALGALFLMISLVYLLNWLVPTLPLWGCWAIIGGVNVAGGIIAFLVGRMLLGRYNPLPDQSLHALEENLTWKTTPPK